MKIVVTCRCRNGALSRSQPDRLPWESQIQVSTACLFDINAAYRTVVKILKAKLCLCPDAGGSSDEPPWRRFGTGGRWHKRLCTYSVCHTHIQLLFLYARICMAAPCCQRQLLSAET